MRDSKYYAANYNLEELRRILALAQNRIVRTYTEQAYLTDAWIIQEVEAAIQMIEARSR